MAAAGAARRAPHRHGRAAHRNARAVAARTATQCPHHHWMAEMAAGVGDGGKSSASAREGVEGGFGGSQGGEGTTSARQIPAG